MKDKKPALTANKLQEQAIKFAEFLSQQPIKKLYGVTDGKAVGTYVELDFRRYVLESFSFALGSAAKGIDFPELLVDVKVTSSKQPQSSCPFRSARQKVYGLGYSVLVFVCEKSDDAEERVARLNIRDVIFVDAPCTADYQTTFGLRRLLDSNANRDDILAFFEERMLPMEASEAEMLAEEVLQKPPAIGYLTISNALQWRLQYSRVIDCAGQTAGVLRLR